MATDRSHDNHGRSVPVLTGGGSGKNIGQAFKQYAAMEGTPARKQVVQHGQKPAGRTQAGLCFFTATVFTPHPRLFICSGLSWQTG